MALRKRKGGLRVTFFVVNICVLHSLFLSGSSAFAQSDRINLMFYNVENLFDTIDQPHTYDEDFTPTSELEYNTLRYQTKLKNLSRVTQTAFKTDLPDIIGLAEVENRGVVLDLASTISKHKYRVFHLESPDQRGIDNAILYDKKTFNLLDSGLIPIDLGPEERPTRGVLWAKFIVVDNPFEFYVFVNHWPSRYGGEEESQWKRLQASKTLSSSLKLLYVSDPDAVVIAMGDFNDYPSNRSVLNLEDCVTGPCLENLSAQFDGTEMGSYVYNGQWGVLDQILVSKNLLKHGLPYKTSPNNVNFVKEDWMLYRSATFNDLFPSRTYGGTNYYGGYSDHLPVTLFLEKSISNQK